MYRKIFFTVLCIHSLSAAIAQFGLYASAAYLNRYGTNTFYNNTAPGNEQDIGSVNFQGVDLGFFVVNTGMLILTGGEVKTFKGATDNVCSATLNFTVYPQGNRPVSPVFTPVLLGFYSDCVAPACSSFFGSFSAGGGCCSDRDQKWQSPGNGSPANIDLTTYPYGIYTLEIYYSYTGEDNGTGCSATKYDNNNNNPTNYTATFTIIPPIPVSFGNIRVVNNRSFNDIYWNTYSEANTSIFTLERSADGSNFSSLSEIPAAGNSNTIRSYSSRDNSPTNGINYYRIKMIESDGSYQYSTIVKTSNRKSPGNWSILQNPAGNKIELTGLETGNEIIIMNAVGREVYHTIATENYQNINSSGFADGVYFIKLVGNREVSARQVIVAH